ncbi:MAG: hypothetical protein IT427_04790 [Pirellulales bacterium]|nr:hypothetical protein [Pirellulales bacterium]
MLQNIEFGFTNAHRRNPRLNDRNINTAIRCALLGSHPEDDLVAKAYVFLVQIRELRSEVAADVWNDGLRVVLGSIQNHSGLRLGETEYLDFVAQFVVEIAVVLHLKLLLARDFG